MTAFRLRPRSNRPGYADLPFFQSWSAADLARLDRLAEHVEYEPGEIVMTHGLQAGREFFVITCGRALVTSHDGTATTVSAGESIGEEAMLVGDSASASVVAQTYLTALLLGPREFHGLLAEAPSLGRRLSLQLATRLLAVAS